MIDEIKDIIQTFIVNNLGINLCSVRNIFITRQKDGQLKEIRIVFKPTKTSDNQKVINEWKASHPNGKKIDCHRDTGISRPTIDNYWLD